MRILNHSAHLINPIVIIFPAGILYGTWRTLLTERSAVIRNFEGGKDYRETFWVRRDASTAHWIILVMSSHDLCSNFAGIACYGSWEGTKFQYS